MRVNLKGTKTLLVDDFREMRIAIKGTLEALGADDIVDVGSGQDALDAMTAQDFDLVLCDYNLGDGKDGQQVLEEARISGLLKQQALFVMITAENTSEMVMGVVEYYPDGYLVKPVSRPVLELRLRKLAQRKRFLSPIEKCIQLKDFQGAAAECDKASQTPSPYRHEAIKLKGAALLTSGALDDAAALFEEVLEERDFPWAMAGLGKAHYLAGRYKQAVEVLTRLIDDHRSYMEAYDWLADARCRLDDPARATEVLASAGRLSPKSIRRQQKLGWLALKQGDYSTSAKAFKNATTFGRYSCYHKPEDHAGLARAYSGDGKPKKAEETLTEGRRRHKKTSHNMAPLNLAEGLHLYAVDRAEQARGLIESTAKDYLRGGGDLEIDGASDLLDLCLKLKLPDAAKGIAKRVLLEHHEDEQLAAQVRTAFEKAGLATEAESLIDGARHKIVEINNEGVKLARLGRMKDAIVHLTSAAEDLPGNSTINLNAAQVLIKEMKANGVTRSYLLKAKRHLAHAARDHKAGNRHRKLSNDLGTLTGTGDARKMEESLGLQNETFFPKSL